VLLDGDGVYLHLGNVRFAERIHQYLEMADVLREHVPEIAYVDLRYGNRVFVGPSESKSLSPTVP
jgi:cell division septal protein FtsQ